MIRFEHFGWRFGGASSPAVEDVSFHIGRGEFVAIAGPSGSGKTTLALAMCGLLVGRQAGEAQGSVHVGGRDVADTPLHEVAETIGLVQQNPQAQFATLTVLDELAFGLENRCRSRDEILASCEQALALLGIEHLRERGLNTLSGGEQQRVAVASIVGGRPEVIVLDEPTASLDPQASRDLFRALADLSRGTGLTVVIIEQRLAQLLPLEPRLICVEAGRVVADSAGDSSAMRPAWLAGPGSVPASQPSQALGDVLADVSHVTVRLGGRTVLDDVSLQVRAGEWVAVMGPNGGGKSTLLHCLTGLTRPARGDIRVCDMAVSPRAVSRLGRHVGLVFQNADHQLVADTVWSEALFAARQFGVRQETSEPQADRLLTQAGLADRRHDHPYRLSWGQKRRLNVISAVLHEPRLLLLDEPLAGQDWGNAATLLDTIEGWLHPPGSSAPSPRACIMITHDPSVVLRSCTRVVFIADGRIVVDAPVPEAFAQLPQLGYAAYTATEAF